MVALMFALATELATASANPRIIQNGRLRRVLNGDEGGNDVFLARGIARRTNERNEGE